MIKKPSHIQAAILIERLTVAFQQFNPNRQSLKKKNSDYQ